MVLPQYCPESVHPLKGQGPERSPGDEPWALQESQPLDRSAEELVGLAAELRQVRCLQKPVRLSVFPCAPAYTVFHYQSCCGSAFERTVAGHPPPEQLVLPSEPLTPEPEGAVKLWKA